MAALTFDDLVPAAAPGGAPAPSGGALTFDDLVPPEKNGTATDVAKSAATGYLKGAIGLAGAPADLGSMLQSALAHGQAWVQGRPLEDVQAENDRNAIISRDTLAKAGSAALTKDLEQAGGAVATAFSGKPQDRTLYQPQTTAGHYAETVGSFLPAAVAGPGGVVRNALTFGVAPGLASEAAGQLTAGSSLEPWARGGAAIAAGGLGAFASRPTTAGGIIKDAVNLTPNQIDAVESLINDAASRGINMSRAEAAQQVTGGATRLGDIQRVVEGNGRLKEFYADRPQQIDQAARSQFDAMVPAAANPSEIGPQVQDAARAGVAATPEGRALSQRLYEAGPRVTPEQAGQVIQPELRGVYDRREGARAAVAEQDYGAARASDSWVPVDQKMVDVTRTTERPMTAEEIAAAQAAPKQAAAGSKPATLAEYIARNGGLSLDGGDAEALGLHNMKVPGAGNVARPTGKSIDSYWREKLIEDGYLPPDSGGGMSRDIRDELYSALENEQRGQPTYSVFDQDKVAARGGQAASAANAQALDAARSNIIRDHYRAGVKPSDLDPATVEKAAQVVASGAEADSLAAYNKAAREVPTVTQDATEQVPQTVYGQVSPNPVIQHIDQQMQVAKGSALSDLQSARRMMFARDGSVDGSVEGLHNARTSINEMIDKANANGQGNSVRVLTGVRDRLDSALQQVPEYAQANRNFQTNSIPLAPFDNTPPISRSIARDEFNQRFTMPPERVPGTLQEGGPSTARAFNDVAPPPAKEAFEQHLVTQVLDAASNGGADLSADSIRKALQQNADLLAQFPGVRDKLTNVAVARDGLERIKGTPLAKLADAQPEVGAAVRVLFPSNPTPNSAGEIAAAVRAVSDRNQWAAKQLVRVHAESIFNEATQATQAGMNQWGGATFAAKLQGNSQQAENLRAAVQALPDGDKIMPGFDRFLQIMQATGMRQRIGSQTAFNTEINAALKEGGTLKEIVGAIASGGFKIPGRVMGKFDKWNLGRNTDQLAYILTAPEAAPLFRHLAATSPTSTKAAALVSRLSAIGYRGAEDAGSTNQH